MQEEIQQKPAKEAKMINRSSEINYVRAKRNSIDGTTQFTVNISVDFSPELMQVLEELSKETGMTRSEVLRKALLLMDVAVDAVRSGGTITVNEAVSPGGELRPKEIVGLVANSVTTGAPTLGAPTLTLNRE